MSHDFCHFIRYSQILYINKNHNQKFAIFLIITHKFRNIASNQKTSQYTSELSTNFHAIISIGYMSTFIITLKNENSSSHFQTFSFIYVLLVELFGASVAKTSDCNQIHHKFKRQI